MYLMKCGAFYSSHNLGSVSEDQLSDFPMLHDASTYSSESPLQEHIADQQQMYAGPDYNINWEEVKEGKAAGMPGAWVS